MSKLIPVDAGGQWAGHGVRWIAPGVEPEFPNGRWVGVSSSDEVQRSENFVRAKSLNSQGSKPVRVQS